MQSETLILPEIGSWRQSVHRFSSRELAAIDAARITSRPLLIRGEPGLGKSQIARAIAKHRKWPLVTTVINARTEVEDLLYRVDQVARLSDANRGVELIEKKAKPAGEKDSSVEPDGGTVRRPAPAAGGRTAVTGINERIADCHR